jgi:hypothetical protein
MVAVVLALIIGFSGWVMAAEETAAQAGASSSFRPQDSL